MKSSRCFREGIVKPLLIVLLLPMLCCDVVPQSERVLTKENSQAATRKFPEIKSKAESGDAEAQYVLGLMYFFGVGASRDKGEAANWTRKAAEQGYAPAQVRLAKLYLMNDLGVREDYTEAFKWLRKAAEQGDPEGLWELGGSYGNGLFSRVGVPPDYTEAIKWYRKAAEQGDVKAQTHLAGEYFFGGEVSQDFTEALRWSRRAAEQGDDSAQSILASIYARGLGVSQNDSEASKWFRRAAEQGYALAQRSLAGRYFEGQGVRQDYVESYKWAILAAAQGDKAATDFRETVLKILTQEQIAEGQRRASVFVVKEAEKRDRIWAAIDFLPNTSPPNSSGSAFFITASGYLLTSSHVVAGAGAITVRTKQGDFSAMLIRADAVNDVALLKVSGSFHPLAVVASHTVKLGDSVMTIGFPNTTLQGVEPKLTRGEINSMAGLRDDPRHFQISVAVQPGNSGGPLVDSLGNVVGIVTARLSEAAALRETGALPQVVNYALKSSFVAAFLESTPDVMSQLPKPDTSKSRRSEDVVKEVQEAAALVLVY